MSAAADPCTFSVLEFREALNAMSDADFGRLEKVARIYAAKTRGRMSPTDLLNEAVLRTLDEGRERRRKWNRDVSIVRHLASAMKSIASHAKSPPEWDPPGPDPDEAEARDGVAQLVRHFEEQNDENALDALLVLEEMAQEKTPAQVRASLGLEQKRYEAIMKAIRRAGERLGVNKGRKKR